MVGLIKADIYKFFKNKKNLMIIAILFIFTMAMVGYNYRQSTVYMKNRGDYFSDKHRYSTSVAATLQTLLDNEVYNGEDPEMIQKRIDYYTLEGKNYQSLGFFYPKDQEKDYKYINNVMNNLYLSMIRGYEEGVIDLEEIVKRGYDIRAVNLLADYTQYLADEDIQPLLNTYKVNGANGMKLFLRGENLIVLLILISLLTADMYLKEMSEGSYKLLLTQPHARKKIYLSKVIAMSCISLILIFSLALVNFILSSAIGGIGDFSYPLMSKQSLNMVTLNGMNESLLIIPLWEYVLRGCALLLALTLFTVMFILMISILTDSNNKTLAIAIIIIAISYGFNVFLDKSSAMNLWYPHSYLFIQNVLEVNNRSNYQMGIIITILCGGVSFLLSYLKFVSKDYLGATD